MGPVKAIETSYKGYRFRSRIEARWGVFLDALGLDWKYEHQGYTLSYGRNYLPDFLIEDTFFLEIKGPHPTTEEFRAATDVCLHIAPLIVFHGDVPGQPLTAFPAGVTSAAWRFVPGPTGGYPQAVGRWWACDHAEALDAAAGTVRWTGKSRARYVQALGAARGARFEHGESGAKRR